MSSSDVLMKISYRTLIAVSSFSDSAVVFDNPSTRSDLNKDIHGKYGMCLYMSLYFIHFFSEFEKQYIQKRSLILADLQSKVWEYALNKVAVTFQMFNVHTMNYNFILEEHFKRVQEYTSVTHLGSSMSIKLERYYYIHAYVGENSSLHENPFHFLAFVVKDHKITFFDPDTGYYIFNAVSKFINALRIYMSSFKSYQSPELSARMICTVYQLKDSLPKASNANLSLDSFESELF